MQNLSERQVFLYETFVSSRTRRFLGKAVAHQSGRPGFPRSRHGYDLPPHAGLAGRLAVGRAVRKSEKSPAGRSPCSAGNLARPVTLRQ